MAKTKIREGLRLSRCCSYVCNSLLIISLATIMLAGMCGNVCATLIKLEEVPLAYDPASGLCWYADLSRFTSNNYQQQLSMIASISIDGFSDFHLADAAAANSLLASITSPSDIQLFTPTDYQYGNLFWAGRTNEVVATGDSNDVYRRVHYFYLSQTSATDVIHQAFSVLDLSLAMQDPDLMMSAWVVGHMDQVPVPEPGSLLLVGVGILVMAVLRRR